MAKIDFAQLIIHEDEDYVVINKPPMISSLEDRNSHINIHQIAQLHDEVLMLCHRLDKETSGCLLLAKSEAAYRHASIQFEKRKVQKVYHAVVEGLHEWKNKIVDAPLLVQSNKVTVSTKGKASKTTFNALTLYKKHTLMECLPESGRMHQIRVHLAEQSASIVGDNMYGGKPFFLSEIKRNFKIGKYEEEQPLIKRFALHAFGLSLPTEKGELSVEAEYPKDMRVLIKQLKANR